MSRKRSRVPGIKVSRRLSTYDRVVRVDTDSDGVLRRASEPIADLSEKWVEALARQMIETVRLDEGAVGLAAPQVGRNVRMVCLRTRHPGGMPIIVVNPTVEPVEGAAVEDDYEGCFSFRDQVVRIKRPGVVLLRGTSLRGEPIQVQLDGILARAAQHEVDHLDGLLIDTHGEVEQWAAVSRG